MCDHLTAIPNCGMLSGESAYDKERLLSGARSGLGKRRRRVILIASAFLLGTFLLVKADVEGDERNYSSSGEEDAGAVWSRLATLKRPHGAIPHRGSLQESSPTPVLASDIGPTATPFRRPSPSPTSAPEPTPDGTSRQVVVPILMYHHVALPGSGADMIRRDLSVSTADFEAQLRYLVERGCQPIGLKELIMHLQVGQPLPAKPVILTFDDGFKDQYTNAYPLLDKYGFKGVFFVITRFLDEGRDEYMSWADIELLHANGMEIGSHSYTHPSLRGKSFDYVVWQVLGSKEAIEARIQEQVRFFSYPSGQYDQQVVDVLRSAGYWGAVTVEPGSRQSSERPFELKRIRVRGTYDLEDFEYWLNHWLAHP